MKSLLHPPSSIVISMALLMTSINTPTCFCDIDDAQYTSCNTGFACGGIYGDLLKYPFWGGNRYVDCSAADPHNLELTCIGGVPMIRLNEVKYRILRWYNEAQVLTVARDDYWDGNICAATDHYKNSTFDNTPFQRDRDQISNVTLLYDCDANPNISANLLYNNTNCNDGTRVVYTVLDPSSVSCTPSAIVVIPIMGYQVSQIGSTNHSLIYALEGGFELRYIGGHFEECQRCVDSGGACGGGASSVGSEFICFCNDGPQTTTCNSSNPTSSISPIFVPKKGSKWKHRLIVIGAPVAGFALVLILFIVMMRRRGIGGQKCIFWKRRKFVDHNDKAFNQNYDSFMPKRYNSAELKRITNSFRDELGKGGFGIVYKGCLPDGRLVAVKVIKESKGNGEDFINEVVSIGRTSHVNIISLLGFCYEVNERALIFEFMPKGSLDKFIYRSGFPNAICDFDWNILFQIAIGIAQGLEYLHKKCASRILHLDIKPQNILLDEDFCPKISDFGLAKICQKKESIVSIPGTRGTIGYMAPEVFSRAFGGVSDKSDVYSYGMLVLEIIGGRNNHDTGGSRSTEMYFPDWIYMDLEQGNTGVNWLAISEEENDTVRKITMVSLWCIQTNPLHRPSMKKVIEWLEGPLQLVPYPPKPSLYSPEIPPPLQISSMSSSTLYETNPITT